MRTFVRLSFLLTIACGVGMAACSDNAQQPSPQQPDGGFDAGVDAFSPEDGGVDADKDAAPLPPDASADAHASVCGNAVVEHDEQCDLGEGGDTPSCSKCNIPWHTLNTTPSDYFRPYPRVASSAQGYMVMWAPDGNRQIVTRGIARSGLASGSEQRVDAPNGASALDTIGLIPATGGFLASWMRRANSELTSLRLRKLDPMGEPLGDREFSLTPAPGEPFYNYNVTLGRDERSLSVIHSEVHPNLTRVPVSEEGAPDPSAATAIASYPESHGALDPRAAMRPDGSLALAWQEFGGNSDKLHVALFKGGKQVWITSIPEAEEYAGSSSLAVSDDGKILVAWTGGKSANDVHATFILEDGTLGKSFLLTAGLANSRPEVAYSTKGEFLVVWQQTMVVFGQRLSSRGELLDAKRFPISDYIGEPGPPIVAAGADGSFLVVYPDYTDIKYRLLPNGFRL